MADPKASPEVPLLDLDTLLHRPTVRIDGVSYELRTEDEMSIVESHEVTQQGKRLDKLLGQETLSDPDKKTLVALLDTLCRRVLLAPDDVHAKLRDPQRGRISKLFFQSASGVGSKLDALLDRSGQLTLAEQVMVGALARVMSSRVLAAIGADAVQQEGAAPPANETTSRGPTGVH